MGRLLVALVARPLARYLETSPATVRAETATRPRTELEALDAACHRGLAGLGLTFAFTLCLPAVGAAIWLIGPGSAQLVRVAVPAVVFGLAVAAVTMLVNVARWTVVAVAGHRGFPPDRRSRRSRRRGPARRPSTVVRWLCTPSTLDSVAAVVVAGAAAVNVVAHLG